MDGDFRGAARGRLETGRASGPDGSGSGAAARQGPPGGPAPAGGLAAGLPCHDVRELTGGGTQAVLMLDGVAYSLRITRAGKLILTK